MQEKQSKIVLWRLFHLRRKELRAKREASMFEASSIGDLAFLLLIFFIVTSSFILRQGIFLSLPAKSAGSVRVEAARLIHLRPLAQDFLWQDKQLNRSQMAQVIARKIKQVKDPIVLIHMNQQLSFRRLVDSLSLAKESGIKKVSIAAEGDKSE